MAATLEDGELWLPSDIFPPDDLPPIHHSRSLSSSRSSSMDDLGRQFSSLNVIADHPPKLVSRPAERLGGKRPMAESSVTAPSPNGSYALPLGPTIDQQPLFNFSQSGPRFPTPPRPVLPSRPANPLVTGPKMETRTAKRSSRTLHGKQNRSLNPLSPFSLNFLGFNSSLRNCRGSTTGTGVFIPRPATSSRTPSFNTATRELSPSASASGLRSHTKTNGLDGQGENYNQITEVGLPKDWTY